MKPKKFKLTGEINDRIEKLIQVIPPMNVVKDGKVVFTTKFITAPDGTKHRAKIPRQVDHRTLLREAYKNNGLAGLSEYCCYIADMINPPKVKDVSPLDQLKNFTA